MVVLYLLRLVAAVAKHGLFFAVGSRLRFSNLEPCTQLNTTLREHDATTFLLIVLMPLLLELYSRFPN